MANQAVQGPCLHGYLSPEHKKTFTITVGILGAVFFAAQFVLPFIVVLVAMPAMIGSGVMSIKDARPEHGAYWAGKIWYPQAQVLRDKSQPTTASLMALPSGPSKDPEHAAEIPLGRPRLLADRDKLWVIASRGVGYFQNNKYFAYPGVPQLGDFSRPFLHNGLPAVIEDRPEGLRLMVFRDNAWDVEREFSLFSGDRLSCIDHLQALSVDGKVHVFLKYKGTLYFREDLFGAVEEGRDPWQVIAPAGNAWTSLISSEGPAVFIHQGNENPAISGYRKAGDSWEAFVTIPQFIITSMGAFPTERPGDIALVTQGFPGSLHRISITGSTMTAKASYGNGFPFPRNFFAMIMIPQGLTMVMPLILVVIYSALMRRHRVTYHETAKASKPFASLTRRAFARIIDTVIMSAPLLLAGGILFSSFSASDDPFSFMQTGFLKILALMAGAFFWMLLCIVVFSVMEGLLGYSPGKRVLGIRVLGTDLQLCGFWRALVRNLLMFVDGFFNCLVGIMVIALNEHWQRVGDMAARTIVVDTKER